MTVERISTGLIFFGAIAVFFLVMPQQVEAVDYGRILPATVPSIAIWVIIVCSGMQLFATAPNIKTDLYVICRTLLFFGAIVLCVFLMGRFGFEYCAPPLALLVMLLIGERRLHWLALGAIVVPLGTWILVEQVLGRLLP